MNRKQSEFKEKALPDLKEKFGYKNDFEVPRLDKIVISRGINSEDAKSNNLIDELFKDISLIAGQKPIMKKAKKSIATFKLREGMPNGVMVTLRRDRMYAFFDKLVSLASPRIRDFQGFKIKADGNGNFTVGIKDQRIFLETENSSNKGLQVTIVTTGNSNEEGRALLEVLGFPFSK